MKKAEKERLTSLMHEATARVNGLPMKVQQHFAKVAAKYSPTNKEQVRGMAEICWWLIAIDREPDALPVLDALCQVDDDFYWMYEAFGSVFATRAWLHERHGRFADAQADAIKGVHWLMRAYKAGEMTETEVRKALERVDVWFARADGERGFQTAAHVLSHALRVLVMYRQFATAGDPAAGAIPPEEFATRVRSGVAALRARIETW
jgi:hypothetical protein